MSGGVPKEEKKTTVARRGRFAGGLTSAKTILKRACIDLRAREPESERRQAVKSEGERKNLRRQCLFRYINNTRSNKGERKKFD